MKKMIKILSLVLALAMVLGMTAFADGTVYYVQKFEYEDVADMLSKDFGHYSFGKVNFATTTKLLAAKEQNPGKKMFTLTSSEGNTSTGNSELWTTADGVRMFGQLRKSNSWGANIYVLENAWNMYKNPNEIFVVSFDALTEGVANDTTKTEGYGYIKLYTRSKSADDGSFTDGEYSIGGLYKIAYKAAVEDDPTTENDETKAAVDSYFTYGFYPKLTHGSGVVHKTLQPNRVYRIAQGLFLKDGAESEDTAYSVRRNTLDGVKVSNTDNSDNAAVGKPIIEALNIQNRFNLNFSYGNIRMYTISKNAEDFNVSTAVTEDVSTMNEKITVKFSQPVSPATFDKTAVTVSENGVALEAADYTVSDVREVIADGKIWSEADITLDLDYDSTYEVAFPASVSNEMLMKLGENNTVTFSTETAPTFDISIAANEGLSAAGAAVEAGAMAGKTVYFTANAANTTGRAVKGEIAIGIYDGEGKLVKVASANKGFENAGSVAFSAAFKMEAGYTAKAFVKGTTAEKVFGN
ncbi:MAG: hypothetical protein IKW02_04060 [Clostridia bacterium]|nr:hypothetical protein [Clostridia bacterium]